MKYLSMTTIIGDTKIVDIKAVTPSTTSLSLRLLRSFARSIGIVDSTGWANRADISFVIGMPMPLSNTASKVCTLSQHYQLCYM